MQSKDPNRLQAIAGDWSNLLTVAVNLGFPINEISPDLRRNFLMTQSFHQQMNKMSHSSSAPRRGLVEDAEGAEVATIQIYTPKKGKAGAKPSKAIQDGDVVGPKKAKAKSAQEVLDGLKDECDDAPVDLALGQKQPKKVSASLPKLCLPKPPPASVRSSSGAISANEDVRAPGLATHGDIVSSSDDDADAAASK